MRKILLSFLILISVSLSACAKTTPIPTSVPTKAVPEPTTVLEVPATSALNEPASGCTVVAKRANTEPTPVSRFPPVGEDDHVKGADTARVTIIEYADFQCPFCSVLAPVIDKLLENYPDDVRFVYRHFPLIGTPEQPFHDKAAITTQAAEAAGEQGKFWEMYDLLYKTQSEWSPLSVAEFETWVIQQASELDLDVEKFEKALTSQELVDLAQAAWLNGQELGVTGTPFLVFNGNTWPSNVSMEYFNVSAVVELTLLEDEQFTECPPMKIDQDKEYLATIKTEKGDITIDLFADKAPLAVNSFIFLAENGWFDNITFHRVIPNFVAQTGDRTGTGFGGPGYYFINEISDLKFDKAGVVGMANSGADSNGSQFFITMGATPNLDGSYTIFGQVIDGMDVVTSLTERDPSQNANLPPGDLILSVVIEEK